MSPYCLLRTPAWFSRTLPFVFQEVSPFLPKKSPLSLTRKFPCLFAVYFPPVAFQEIPLLLPGKVLCCFLGIFSLLRGFLLLSRKMTCSPGSKKFFPKKSHSSCPGNFPFDFQHFLLCFLGNFPSRKYHCYFLRNVTFAFQEFPPCFLGIFLLWFLAYTSYGLLESSLIAFYKFPEYFPLCF